MTGGRSQSAEDRPGPAGGTPSPAAGVTPGAGGQTPSPAPGDEFTVIWVGLGAARRTASKVAGADWPEVLSLYHRTVTRIVFEYGGTVLRFDDDAALACFGYAQPGDSGARDALAAALDTVRAVDRLTTTVPARFGAGDLRARVGIHTGPVSGADEIDRGVEPGADLAGDVGRAAAVLLAAAGPGEVLASGAAVAQVGPYFEMVPVRAPEGPDPEGPDPEGADPEGADPEGADRDSPGEAYRVLRLRQARPRPEVRPPTPFVARQSDLAWLERQWRAVLDGSTRTVVVLGEAGIGKSRLVFEFAASVAAGGGRVLTLNCGLTDMLTPLHPFGALMGAVPPDPDAALTWLKAGTESGTSMLLVEDVQWADDSTIEVIARAAELDLPLLVVLTSRPGPLRDLEGAVPDSQRLWLDRLPVAEARTFVDLVLGEERLGADVIDGLLERAEGVPLYLEELTRNAAEQSEGDPLAIPATVMEVIRARLDGLGEAKRMAQLAAVIGREFDPDLVRALSGLAGDGPDGRHGPAGPDGPAGRHGRDGPDGRSGRDPGDGGDGGEFERQLGQLISRMLVEAVPDGSGTGGLRFRHILICQAAYESLPPAEKRRAHSFVADYLVAAAGPPCAPQVIAHHLERADRYGEAVAMWRNAARTARRFSRFREAAAHERKILALLPHLEEDHRDSVELKARSRLAMCLTAVDQSAPEILGEAVRAQDLARAYGDDRTVLDTYLILLPYWQARADYAAIEEALPELHRLVRQAGDPAYGYAVAMVEASVRIWQGSLTEGLRQLGEMFERGGIPLRESLRTLPSVSAPTVLMRSSSRVAAALGFWLTGDARSAWRLVDDTLLFAIERGVTAAQAVTCATAALIAQLDGDPARAAGFATQAENAPEATATLQWRRWGAALHRWATGRCTEVEVPGLMLRPYFLMLTTDEQAMGADQVTAVLDEALQTARSSGERFCEAELLRKRARAHYLGGSTDRAAADLGEACEVARSQLARSLELRALTDRVSLLGESSARPRLAQLVASLGVDGPVRSIEAANRALES